MKSVFPEWYGPSDDEIREFLTAGTIALDANILLALYRVNESQRKQVLAVLAKLADRLWVPHQAALEYQRGRLGEVSSQLKAHDAVATIATTKVRSTVADAIDSLGKLRDEAMSKVRDKEIRASIKEEFDTSVEELQRALDNAQERMEKRFSELRETHAIDFTDAKNDDPIRSALDELITEERVGARPDAATYASRMEEVERRKKEKLPPGYKDDKKEDSSGDRLIWIELMEYARKSNRRILFITDDEKEDWYQEARGQIIGPRIELRAEMASSAQQSYHQTTLDGFLRLANAHLQTAVPEDTITTLESVRVEANFEVRAVAAKLLDIRIDVDQHGFINFFAVIDLRGEGRTRVLPLRGAEQIRELGILIGDEILVYSGPRRRRILGPLIDARTGSEYEFVPPTHCPICDSDLVQPGPDSGGDVKCPNEGCPSREAPDGLSVSKR